MEGIMKRVHLFSILLMAGAAAAVQAGGPLPGYDDTPLLPGSKWRGHDKNRPYPVVVMPGTSSTQESPGKAPSDAVVLFDGKDLSQWETARIAGCHVSIPWAHGPVEAAGSRQPRPVPHDLGPSPETGRIRKTT